MDEPASLTSTLVREQLSRILASRALFRAGYLRHFLEVCVSETLDGNSGYLKELWLAAEVFGRRGDFDPGLDPIVTRRVGDQPAGDPQQPGQRRAFALIREPATLQPSTGKGLGSQISTNPTHAPLKPPKHPRGVPLI